MSLPAPDPTDDETAVDRIVADRLARPDPGAVPPPVRLSATDHEDLLRRLNALDFVDSLVGGVTMPDRIGDYRVTGLLGRGGMGTVYGAFQESLEREVALKVLSLALSADPTMRRRFRTEARATASLHHQHIVPIYDFGEVQGLLYFAMEKIEGVSLDQHIARARREGRPLFSPSEAARRFAGVADALAHAHRRRILHRDVKPGNLLVHADGTLALADFGLSRILGEASVRSSGRGGFVGTLQYASPEQARSQHLTPASDLYSLGITIFEAVTGHLPFRAESPEAVLEALLNQEPRNLRALRPDVPADFAAIVEKLLHKEPSDRYGDAEALGKDLRRFADGEPVHVRRQPLVVRAWRRVRRRPGLSAAIAAALVLGITATYAVAARAVELQRSRQARYQSLLDDAVRALADAAGPLGGPDDLFAVLTGVSHAGPADGDSSQAVNAAIERARSFAPESDRADALQRAFAAPGDTEAEALLRSGQGRLAKRRLDERIEQSVRESLTSPSSDPIRLYRLFVARAVACMTAAVGDPVQARADLQYASLYRRGAFAPRVLATVIELASARDTEPVWDELERCVRSGPAGAARVAMELIAAAVGEDRQPGAQMVRFGLAPGQRSALLQAAQERFAGSEGPGAGERWSGLEGEIAAIARAAAAADPVRRAALAAAARQRLADEVDPRAPMQSWAYVFEMLAAGEAADQRVVAVERQPHACLDLLALDPAPSQLSRVARLFASAADVADSRGEPALAAELRARLQLRLDPRRARPLVEQWVEHARADPEAYMARFLCCVAEDLLPEAKDAATVAVQLAPRRGALVQRVVARLRAAAATAPPPRAAGWADACTDFERIL